MLGVSGGPVVTNSCVYFHFTREAAGALGARHSPRPLLGGNEMHNSGDSRRGNADSYLTTSLRAQRSNPVSLLSRAKKAGLLRRIRLRPKAGFGEQESSSQ